MSMSMCKLLKESITKAGRTVYNKTNPGVDGGQGAQREFMWETLFLKHL